MALTLSRLHEILMRNARKVWKMQDLSNTAMHSGEDENPEDENFRRVMAGLDEVASAFHKNRPPFSGLMVWVDGTEIKHRHVSLLEMSDIDKTPDDGI